MIKAVLSHTILVRLDMSKDIEMFAIGESDEPVVGTEIFDPNMPSNLDFDSKEEENLTERGAFKA